jgi:hypothetical protein
MSRRHFLFSFYGCEERFRIEQLAFSESVAEAAVMQPTESKLWLARIQMFLPERAIVLSDSIKVQRELGQAGLGGFFKSSNVTDLYTLERNKTLLVTSCNVDHEKPFITVTDDFKSLPVPNKGNKLLAYERPKLA